MDVGLEPLANIPGTVADSNFWDISRQWDNTQKTHSSTEHPFTQIQITDKGLDIMAHNIASVRDAVGHDIPLASRRAWSDNGHALSRHII